MRKAILYSPAERKLYGDLDNQALKGHDVGRQTSQETVTELASPAPQPADGHLAHLIGSYAARRLFLLSFSLCPILEVEAFYAPLQSRIIFSLKRVMIPGLAGGLGKPWKGIIPRGTERSATCITCPAARKRALFFKINFLAIIKLLLFSRFARFLKLKLFYPPQQSWGLSLR